MGSVRMQGDRPGRLMLAGAALATVLFALAATALLLAWAGSPRSYTADTGMLAPLLPLALVALVVAAVHAAVPVALGGALAGHVAARTRSPLAAAGAGFVPAVVPGVALFVLVAVAGHGDPKALRDAGLLGVGVLLLAGLPAALAGLALALALRLPALEPWRERIRLRRPAPPTWLSGSGTLLLAAASRHGLLLAMLFVALCGFVLALFLAEPGLMPWEGRSPPALARVLALAWPWPELAAALGGPGRRIGMLPLALPATALGLAFNALVLAWLSATVLLLARRRTAA